ncbi:hypothetical protein FZC84_04450 [Rossellomorea vietnamensis]|uniref:Resolvase HTH domain-containing protein n=1 Tax=Rossellomorea vietnamensis TaxID=218284 RepID=A0A5D4MID1_9BACI|nr:MULTISPECIES: hypothetical protein [Bacillaceae]TYS00751.1 hypothetical protein FZC84_04450 [Rossellomorea vietnamensis]
MTIIIISLLSLSTLLFIVSFFQKDRYTTMEKDMEELSMNFLQENYTMKKRLKILEEELLMDEGPVFQTPPSQRPKKKVHEIVKNQVLALHAQGMNLEQIAKQSALPVMDVQEIIRDRSV